MLCHSPQCFHCLFFKLKSEEELRVETWNLSEVPFSVRVILQLWNLSEVPFSVRDILQLWNLSEVPFSVRVILQLAAPSNYKKQVTTKLA